MLIHNLFLALSKSIVNSKRGENKNSSQLVARGEQKTDGKDVLPLRSRRGAKKNVPGKESQGGSPSVRIYVFGHFFSLFGVD